MNHTMSAVPHGHDGIVGDYTLGALLGSGSFGSVHHVNAVSTAAHERLAATPGYAKDMSLAIKVLRVGSRGVNRHDLERRFNREVEALANGWKRSGDLRAAPPRQRIRWHYGVHGLGRVRPLTGTSAGPRPPHA